MYVKFLIIFTMIFALNTSCSLFSSASNNATDDVKPTRSLEYKTSNSEIEQIKSKPAPIAPVEPTRTAHKDDDVFLRQAQIMARMDEIEAELKRQREKVRLLEQGLLTGIAPDEIKSARNTKNEKLMEKTTPTGLRKPELDEVESIAAKDQKRDSRLDLNGDSKKDEKNLEPDSNLSFDSKIQLAKEHYQAGRFGLAIAELASMSRQFGENSGDGSIKVWLGKSYLGLKEFSTARAEFEHYLKGWPTGEHVGFVRIDLAKSYVGLGLKERARGELRRVMKEFEGQDIAEIASVEFQKLQGGI